MRHILISRATPQAAYRGLVAAWVTKTSGQWSGTFVQKLWVRLLEAFLFRDSRNHRLSLFSVLGIQRNFEVYPVGIPQRDWLGAETIMSIRKNNSERIIHNPRGPSASAGVLKPGPQTASKPLARPLSLPQKIWDCQRIMRIPILPNHLPYLFQLGMPEVMKVPIISTV